MGAMVAAILLPGAGSLDAAGWPIGLIHYSILLHKVNRLLAQIFALDGLDNEQERTADQEPKISV